MKKILLLLMFLLTACASSRPPEDVVWKQIGNITRADYVGNGEIYVYSRKPVLLDAEGLELAMLARAASEVLAQGGERFIVRRVEYRQDFDLLRPDIPAIVEGPITSYADLRTARDESTAILGRVRTMRAVIEIVDDRPMLLTDTFDAADTRDALTQLWASRYARL